MTPKATNQTPTEPAPPQKPPTPDSALAKAPTPNTPPPSAPPPRGPSLRVIAVVLLVGIAALVAGTVWSTPIRQATEKLSTLIKSTHGPDDGHDHASAATKYHTCGMHPWIVLPKMGLCPICHMDLVPLDPAKFTGQISIDPVVAQNIGVRVETVRAGALERTLRTVGSLAYDETRLFDISVRTRSRIVKWYNTCCIGNKMEVGSPIADLHSPDVLAASREMLVALGPAQVNQPAPAPGSAPANNVLFQAARNKLRLYGVSNEQIEEIIKTRQVPEFYTVHFPVGGVLTRIGGNVGQWIEEAGTLAVVADASQIWVYASVFEQDLPWIKSGDTTAIRLTAVPDTVFTASVDAILPQVDPATRFARARLTLPNPDGKLKAGMYASVELRSKIADEAVLVPRSAVIDTGQRAVAFVSLGKGRFEPRDVRLGLEMHDGQVQVLEGLKAGEPIVVSGQFLLDSESKAREALAKMVRGTLAAEPEKIATPTVALDAAGQATLAEALRLYLSIGDTLAKDTNQGVADQARALATALEKMPEVQVPGDAHFWHQNKPADLATRIAGGAELDAMRIPFAELSNKLAALLAVTGVPASLGQTVEKLHCPMYHEDRGLGTWMQIAGAPRNPFWGATMLACFDTRIALPAAAAPTAAAAPASDAPVSSPSVSDPQRSHR